MNELDRKIKQALGEQEPGSALGPGDEPSVFDLMLDVFRGRHKWLAILTASWMVVFFGLAIFCAIRFFQAEETRDILLWGMGFFCCFTAVGMLKVWYWMEMNKSALTREIKRLELQIAELANKLDSR